MQKSKQAPRVPPRRSRSSCNNDSPKPQLKRPISFQGTISTVSQTYPKRNSYTESNYVEAFIRTHPAMNVTAEECKRLAPIGEPVVLQTFCNSFKPPALVRFVSDYYSLMGGISLGCGEILMIITVQSAKVIQGVIEDEPFKLVPQANQEISFSPLENGTQHTYTYSELLQADPLPVIVSPMRTFTDKKRQKLIERGTRLLLKHKSSWIKREKTLRITDLNQIDITVPENTDVTFSAKPEDVCLSPEETVKHFTFPILVKPVSNDDDINTIPEIELRRVETEEIAVGIIRFGQAEVSMNFLPSSTPLKLEVIRIEEGSSPEGYVVITQHFLNKVSAKPTDNEASQNYYDTVDGYDLPRETQKPKLGLAISSKRRSESLASEGGYVVTDLRPESSQIPNKLTGCQKEDHPRQYEHFIPVHTPPSPGDGRWKVLSQRPTPKARQNKLTSKSISLDQETISERDELDQNLLVISSKVSVGVQTDFVSVLTEASLNAQKTRSIAVQTDDTSTGIPVFQNNIEENRALLRSLSVDQILQLLRNMKLECYQESFENELIDGELFSTLDDTTLSELGVNKILHCIRIKKVASGTTSVKTFSSQNN